MMQLLTNSSNPESRCLSELFKQRRLHDLGYNLRRPAKTKIDTKIYVKRSEWTKNIGI